MTSTPSRCHQTLTLLNRATSRTPRVFSSAWTTRITAKIMIVWPGVAEKPNCISSRALVKKAAPKSTPAVTATCPMKLNQPVNQLHAGPLVGASRAAQ